MPSRHVDDAPMPSLGDTQTPRRPGIIELGIGEPDPALLPVEVVAQGCERALKAFGPGALAYGDPGGPEALRALLRERIAHVESERPDEDELMVTGGASQALGLLLTVLARPGDVVFAESPTYNLALGVIRDYPVELVGVPSDEDGMWVGARARAVETARAAGRRPLLLYTVPTFHNPTGGCLEAARREQLVELAAREGLLIVEDDVYRELVYDGAAPLSLWATARRRQLGGVARLGSFSKTLAPGLRVGWLTADRDLVDRAVQSGVLQSGGGVSHFSASVVAAFLQGGVYEAHLEHLQRTYAGRRDALADALGRALPAGCSFAIPRGGFFIWLRLPASANASELLPRAEAAGVAFVPGERFSLEGDDQGARLCFALYDEEQLAEAARRLGLALRRSG